MVCAPERGDNPRALARGLSTVQAHKPCSISLVPSSADFAHYRVSRAKVWVSVDCGIRNLYMKVVRSNFFLILELKTTSTCNV